MNNATILLQDILRLKKDLEKQDMRLPPGLAGMYGEILVFQKIQKIFKKKGYIAKYFSGQKGADLQMLISKDILNIEVKTSRLKEEGFGLWYGAALNIKKCTKLEHQKVFYSHPKKRKIFGDFCYFDYLIFVALNEQYKPKFYVIPRTFIEKNKESLQNKHTRFLSATHRIIISNGAMPSLPDIKTQKSLIKRTEKFENRWDLIKPLKNTRARVK